MESGVKSEGNCMDLVQVNVEFELSEFELSRFLYD